MTLVADTHVHVYPGQDLTAAFRAGLRNLTALARAAGAADAALALCLSERSDCHLFEGLVTGRELPAGFELARGPAPVAVSLTSSVGTLHVFAGRQIVTRERLEVLALGSEAAPPDGEPLRETVEAVLASGALAVLPWSPGKWLGARGRALGEFLAESPTLQARRPLLADSSLRGRGLPRPALLAGARARSLVVVAGTDPLPLPGEERLIGSYATLSPAVFDPTHPLATLRVALEREDVQIVGRRRSLPGMLERLISLRLRRLS